MMHDVINIGGKEFRVEVNWRSILSFLSIKDTDKMECLDTMSVPDWVSLMGCCIIEGERLEGHDVSESIADEIFALRPAALIETVKAFIRIYNVQSSPKLPEESKKD